MNLWSPCFGKMDACLNFITKNHSCYTPPSRSIQHISKHRNSFINQKNLKPKYQPIHLPSKAPGFLYPVHFLFIFLNKVFERSTLKLSPPNSSAKSLWHVETGTRRPWRSIKERKGPVSQAPMRLRVATKKWERPKGSFSLGGVEFW